MREKLSSGTVKGVYRGINMNLTKRCAGLKNLKLQIKYVDCDFQGENSSELVENGWKDLKSI